MKKLLALLLVACFTVGLGVSVFAASAPYTETRTGSAVYSSGNGVALKVSCTVYPGDSVALNSSSYIKSTTDRYSFTTSYPSTSTYSSYVKYTGNAKLYYQNTYQTTLYPNVSVSY
jgi:hypothetical protein